MAKLSRNILVILAALSILVIVLFGITILRGDDDNPVQKQNTPAPNGTILRDDDDNPQPQPPQSRPPQRR